MNDFDLTTVLSSIPAHINHCGVVVRDMDATIRALKTIFHLDPVREAMTPEGDDRTYMGEFEDWAARLAFYRFGDLEFEFIQPIRGRSSWSDHLERYGNSFHHVRYAVKNFAQSCRHLEELGIRKVQGGGSVVYPGAVFGYFDTTATLGYYLEIFNPEECGYTL